MKKIFSIVLLILFLINVVGYYGVYLVLRYQSNLELKKKLDAENYQANEILNVKIPYTLPYQMDWKGYERIDGEFQLNGVFYKLVKHKLERDTLHIVYIKDHRETSLFRSLVDFVQANSDIPVSQKALKFIEKLAKDYISVCSNIQIASTGWSRDYQFGASEYQVICADTSIFTPPPESLS